MDPSELNFMTSTIPSPWLPQVKKKYSPDKFHEISLT